MIEAVAADVVVFSAGFMNQWRMPNQQVVKRYQSAGVQTFNTAEHGMVQVDFNDGRWQVSRYRQDMFPFWFSN